MAFPIFPIPSANPTIMRAVLAFVFVLWANIAVVSSILLEAVGHWELTKNQIVCVEDYLCDYYFLMTGPVDDTLYVCHFQVRGEDGVPANKTQFRGASCGPNDSLRVNGSWEDGRNIVLCFTHVAAKVWAFFGFDRWEIESGRLALDKYSPVYPISVFEKRQQTDRRTNWPAERRRSVLEDYLWSIKWLDRCE